MKTLTFTDREGWLAARRGKITGTRLKDIVTLRGNGKKIGFYELIAERLGIPADDESAMDRGLRLEEEALKEFSIKTGKKLDVGLKIWAREDNPNIAVTPDAVVQKKKEAVEVKCLSSARHIEALLTQKVPSDYEMQILQYFVVNDDLKTVYMVFFDPRLLARPFFFLTINREEVQEKVDEYLEYERKTLEEVEQAVNQISF